MSARTSAIHLSQLEQKEMLQRYADPTQCNQLQPPTLLLAEDGHHRPRIGFWQVTDATENGGQIYPIRSGKAPRKGQPDTREIEGWALTKSSLMQLASLAGVTWDPAQTGIQSSSAGEIVYRATGQVEGPNGKPITASAEASEKSMKPGYDGAPPYPAPFAREKAESRAKNRVLRDLLGMKSKYSLEDIQKPFGVLRWEFVPPQSEKVDLLLTAGYMASRGMLEGSQQVIAGVLAAAFSTPQLAAPAEAKQLAAPVELQSYEETPSTSGNLQTADPRRQAQVERWRKELNDLTAGLKLPGEMAKAAIANSGTTTNLDEWTEVEFQAACEAIRDAAKASQSGDSPF